MLPVEMHGASTCRSPESCMIAPLPYCFSICDMTRARLALRVSALRLYWTGSLVDFGFFAIVEAPRLRAAWAQVRPRARVLWYRKFYEPQGESRECQMPNDKW